MKNLEFLRGKSQKRELKLDFFQAGQEGTDSDGSINVNKSDSFEKGALKSARKYKVISEGKKDQKHGSDVDVHTAVEKISTEKMHGWLINSNFF